MFTSGCSTKRGAQTVGAPYVLSAAGGGIASTASAPTGGTYLLGQIWRAGLLSDGKMGASQERSSRIRRILGGIK